LDAGKEDDPSRTEDVKKALNAVIEEKEKEKADKKEARRKEKEKQKEKAEGTLSSSKMLLSCQFMCLVYQFQCINPNASALVQLSEQHFPQNRVGLHITMVMTNARIYACAW
jgi:hypothetical protein